MKIFLIGKFQNFEETRQKFQPWADNLRKFGHEVINPLEILTGDKDWFESTGQCLKLLMECNAIFLLNDWKVSPIGKLTFSLAMNLHYDIFMEHDMNFLRQMGEQGSDPPTMKINPSLILDWLNEKIKRCKDGIYITEALNDKKKEEYWQEEFKNFEMARDIILQKTELSHAENHPA